jgi:very-short-patch-repair endonuclease
MPFDFGLEEEKVLIELDGIQHFEQVSNWRCHKEIREKDVEKIRKAMKAGYSVIHLYQPEVWEDRYEWKRVLKEQVESLVRRETSVCLFISQKEVYGAHIQGMDGMTYEVIQP